MRGISNDWQGNGYLYYSLVKLIRANRLISRVYNGMRERKRKHPREDLGFIFEEDERNTSPSRSMDESSQWHRGAPEEETPRHDANLWTVQPGQISQEGRQTTDSASEGDQAVGAKRRDLAQRQNWAGGWC